MRLILFLCLLIIDSTASAFEGFFVSHKYDTRMVFTSYLLKKDEVKFVVQGRAILCHVSQADDFLTFSDCTSGEVVKVKVLKNGTLQLWKILETDGTIIDASKHDYILKKVDF
jgi:hypothetical protein